MKATNNKAINQTKKKNKAKKKAKKNSSSSRMYWLDKEMDRYIALSYT